MNATIPRGKKVSSETQKESRERVWRGKAVNMPRGDIQRHGQTSNP